MYKYLAEGFSLGLSLGIVCVQFCGAIYAPFLIKAKRELWESFKVILLLTGGRFFSYALFGIAAGALGGSLPSEPKNFIVHSMFSILGIYLVTTAFSKTKGTEEDSENPMHKTFPFNIFSRFTGKLQRYIMNLTDNPFFLGMLTGAEICPPFLMAIARSADIGGITGGVSLFVGFFLGSSIFIMPITFLGLASKVKSIRYIARIVAIVVGVWFFMKGASGLILDFQQRKVKHETVQSVNILKDSDSIYFLNFPRYSKSYLMKMFSPSLRGSVIFKNSENINIEKVQRTVFLYPRTEQSTKRVKKFAKSQGNNLFIFPRLKPQERLTDENKRSIKKVRSFLTTYSFKEDTSSIIWDFRRRMGRK